MKLLVCAHPDDEVLWFNPSDFQWIIIVFGNFGDERGSDGGDRRRKAISEHPLVDKIVHFNITESNFTRDKKKESVYKLNQKVIEDELKEFVEKNEVTEVTTHNGYGEYGHLEHIQLFYAGMNSFDCPVNGKDPKIFRATKRIYGKYGVWTWYG